jgi:tetratricopeptide (TPR) repeat protein
MTNEAPNLKEEGLRLFREGDYAEAIARFETARRLFSEAGDAAQAGEMLNNVGLCHRAQKHWGQAQEALEAALAEFRTLGDRSREAQALGNLGALAESQGDRKRAAELYEQAAAIFQELGDEENRAFTLKSLSTLQMKQGRHLEALASMDSSLSAAPKLSVTQRVLRWLLQWPMKMLGGR